MYGIFTYIWLFLMVKYGINVGKYTSPMDGMGSILVLSSDQFTLVDASKGGEIPLVLMMKLSSIYDWVVATQIFFWIFHP